MNKLFPKAMQAIEKNGILLVYPIKNKKEPASLWSKLFPHSEMVWEWDEDADNRVAQLWHLREELSRSEKVVYAKWYQGRATFFSTEVFTHLLAFCHTPKKLSPTAKNILDVLEQDSPISTKTIKSAVDLQGRSLESLYNKAMKELWLRLWIVGFGEVEDSSFPSLAVGATSLLFEDLWRESKKISSADAEAFLVQKLGENNPFLKYAKKLMAQR